MPAYYQYNKKQTYSTIVYLIIVWNSPYTINVWLDMYNP